MRLPRTIRLPKTVRGHLPRRPIMIAIGAGVVALSFLIALKAMDWLSARSTSTKLPAQALKELPPLPPVTRSSFVVAPVVVALSAIRDARRSHDAAQFRRQGRQSGGAGAAECRYRLDRRARPDRGDRRAGHAVAVDAADRHASTSRARCRRRRPARSAMRSRGLLGDDAAKQIGSVNIKALNANAEIKGNVVITSRPKLAAAWRLEPNLGAQVNLGDTNLSVAGARVNVPAQVKPVIDKTVGEQLNVVAERIRNDPIIERTARQEWAKACRSVPLQGPGATSSLPLLWLELKPTRAIAAQPLVDASAVTLTMGIEADTRITPTETRPDCPFPDKITIVPPTAGGVSIAVPIDCLSPSSSKIVNAEISR